MRTLGIFGMGLLLGGAAALVAGCGGDDTGQQGRPSGGGGTGTGIAGSNGAQTGGTTGVSGSGGAVTDPGGVGGTTTTPPPAGEAAECVQQAQEQGRYIGQEACVDCGCQHCAEFLELCYDSDNQMLNDLCIAVVECGQAAGCRGPECYCGPADVVTCATLGPQGPCVAQIEAAAGAHDAIGVAEVRDSGDRNNALVRANLVGDCTRGSPGNEGFAGIGESPAVAGNCEVECN